MTSTTDVLDNHLTCFGRRDLEGLLSDYAPDAVLFTQDGPLRGPDAIKPLFEAMLEEFGKPGASFSLKQRSVEGDHAYIVWTAQTADNVYELGTDTFVDGPGIGRATTYAYPATPRWRSRESGATSAARPGADGWRLRCPAANDRHDHRHDERGQCDPVGDPARSQHVGRARRVAGEPQRHARVQQRER